MGRRMIRSITIWKKPIRSMIRKILEMTELSKCPVSCFFYTPGGWGLGEGVVKDGEDDDPEYSHLEEANQEYDKEDFRDDGTVNIYY